MNKLKENEPQRKRSKLVLPAPQTTDAELDELVKMGQTADAAMVVGSENGANLLQDYSVTPATSLSARTPRAPQSEDPLIREAQNIIAFNATTSVLEGGENTPLHDGGGSFDGLTPASKVFSTPNTVLSTPYRGSTGATPRVGDQTAEDPGATPLRDMLGINSEGDSTLLTPRSQADRLRQAQARSDLREGLLNLPAPAGDYDIVVPEMPDDIQEESGHAPDFIEDAADYDSRYYHVYTYFAIYHLFF